MFEVGFTEIVLILGLALLVLGPEKLPGLAEKVGRWTGQARSMARQLRSQLEQEVTLEEMSKSKPTPPPQYDSDSDQTPATTQEPKQPASTSPPTDHAFDLDAFATTETAPPGVDASHEPKHDAEVPKAAPATPQ